MSFTLGIDHLDFKNMPVTIIAKRKIPEIDTPGISIEETDSGREMVVPLWVAFELVESDLAQFADEIITVEEWTQIHYRERFQPLGQPTSLPDNFYAKVHLTFIRELMSDSSDQIKSQNLEKLKGRFRDILESRIGKITRLASAEAPALMRGLQHEEITLYRELKKIISTWRESIKKLGEG